MRLLKKLIEMVTVEGDWVLDDGSGPGSALVAAATIDRNGVAIEIECAVRKAQGEFNRTAAQ